MAHPIRPESYIKMDNFYTLTVYEKGAEVVRLYEQVGGSAGLRHAVGAFMGLRAGVRREVGGHPCVRGMRAGRGEPHPARPALAKPTPHPQIHRCWGGRASGRAWTSTSSATTARWVCCFLC